MNCTFRDNINNRNQHLSIPNCWRSLVISQGWTHMNDDLYCIWIVCHFKATAIQPGQALGLSSAFTTAWHFGGWWRHSSHWPGGRSETSTVVFSSPMHNVWIFTESALNRTDVASLDSLPNVVSASGCSSTTVVGKEEAGSYYLCKCIIVFLSKECVDLMFSSKSFLQ